MKEQLTQYVNLLFAGTQNCEEIRQEILQNTLDRYDDLIAQGKVPEAAYRLAISGIGDINEILGSAPRAPHTPAPSQPEDAGEQERKKLRAMAIALYILSPIPLIALSELGVDILGLCLTLIMVAVATMQMITTSRSEPEEERKSPVLTPHQELKKSVGSVISTLGVVLFFVISFYTGAWAITWLIFPLTGAIRGLVSAILDLKEARNYEN